MLDRKSAKLLMGFQGNLLSAKERSDRETPSPLYFLF
jgi:hypothetical protein